MNYLTIQPPESLKPYIRFFWVLEHDLPQQGEPYIYRSIADSCVEMVFHYKATFNEITTNGHIIPSASGIQFQTNSYKRFITDQSFGIFGVYIYPFSIPYFFNIPSSETSNQAFDYDTFLNREGRELEERIVLAADHFERVNILSSFFEQRLANKPLRNDNVMAAIKHIIHTKQPGTVTQLADKFNLSVRQFDRKFKEYAGFSPKLYYRLTRLHNAIQQYGAHKSLTQIALECGYYDQSHFIHDLKAFTGYNPGYYFSGLAEGTEYRGI